jgi:hypothetical protein
MAQWVLVSATHAFPEMPHSVINSLDCERQPFSTVTQYDPKPTISVKQLREHQTQHMFGRLSGKAPPAPG